MPVCEGLETGWVGMIAEEPRIQRLAEGGSCSSSSRLVERASLPTHEYAVREVKRPQDLPPLM
jgi:hypothetical protein